MKVFGEGFALCAHRASLTADVFRLGAFGRFQNVPPPKSFPFWRFLSVSRSASSRCFASALSFAFLAFARDRCPAMVAASYGAKTWRDDCSDLFGLRTVLFFRPEDVVGKIVSGIRESDWVGKGAIASFDWSKKGSFFGDSAFWRDKTARD